MNARRRAKFAAALAVAGLAGAASSASASFHFMKVREVFPDSGTSDYVELQMTAAGQNLVNTHSITVYNSSGMLSGSFTFTGNVASGANQSTILIGDSGVIGADLTPPPSALDIGAGGGAVCWPDGAPSDCVVWGSITTQMFLPDQQSALASPAGVTPGMAIRRTISQGCATLLDGADDTNNSAADFAEAAPNPRNNSVAPTETACVGIPPITTPTTPAPKKKKCKKAKKRSAAAAKKCKKK